MQERVQRDAGHLFPGGISPELLASIIEYDGKYTLEELKDMCRQAGLGVSGDKKMLAARLIASREGHGVLSIKELPSRDAAPLFPYGVPDGFSIEQHQKNGVIIGFIINDPTRIFTIGTSRRGRIVDLLHLQHPEIAKAKLENCSIAYDELAANVFLRSSEDSG